MDQGDQQGAGIGQALGVILPLAALGAGIARPSTAPAFANLSGELYRQDAAAARRADAEEERAGRGALASHLSRLYPDVAFDPMLPTSSQMGLANLYDARARTIADVEQKRRESAERQRVGRAYGSIAEARGRVGQELPDVLRSTATALGAEAGNDPGTREAHKDLLAKIDESAARLASASALARPFEETEDVEITPQPAPEAQALRETLQTFGGEGGEPEYSLGVGPLSVPPIRMTTVPDNVHALQRHIMQTGQVPTEKTAEGLASQFGLPMRSLPGGTEAARAAIAPKHAPSETTTQDAQGNVYRVVTWMDPDTNQPRVQVHQLGRIGQPQQPPSYNQAEIINSLEAIITGHGQSLPIHQGHTPQSASEVREVFMRAQGQSSPQLAANIISLQMETTQERIKQLNLIAQDDQRPLPARNQAKTALLAESAKLADYNRQLELIKVSGMSRMGAGEIRTPSRPPAPANADQRMGELQGRGFVK